jgi:hypothetical protein
MRSRRQSPARIVWHLSLVDHGTPLADEASHLTAENIEDDDLAHDAVDSQIASLPRPLIELRAAVEADAYAMIGPRCRDTSRQSAPPRSGAVWSAALPSSRQ